MFVTEYQVSDKSKKFRLKATWQMTYAFRPVFYPVTQKCGPADYFRISRRWIVVEAPPKNP